MAPWRGQAVNSGVRKGEGPAFGRAFNG